jgi:hypothetical protein
VNTQQRRLQAAFRRFERASCRGVPGVIVFRSGVEGPVVGLSGLTHGNEPSGLAAIEHIRRRVEGQGLLRGTLFLMLNNLRAARAYLLDDRSINCRHPNRRYVDHNMNRLPTDPDLLNDANVPYEFSRARQMLPLWRNIQYGIDFHSMSRDTPPMIITRGNQIPGTLIAGMDLTRILTNFDGVQIGKPAVAYYGVARRRGCAFQIEVGEHESPTAFARAIRYAEVFLRNLRLIAGRPTLRKSRYELFRVYGYVKLRNRDDSLTRHFNDFEKIPKDTLLACGPGGSYVAPYDSHSLFCPSDPELLYNDEEAFFLSHLAQVIRA